MLDKDTWEALRAIEVAAETAGALGIEMSTALEWFTSGFNLGLCEDPENE